MTIYTRGGAPVELIEVYRGTYHRQGFTLFKAKQTGPYPDGSGTKSIGTILHADDRTAHGWLCIGDLSAEGGIREIFDTADKIKDSPKPKNWGEIMNYYWPNWFDKTGRYGDQSKKKKAA